MGQNDTCCVKGCKNKRSVAQGTSYSYFKFPTGPSERHSSWVVFAQRKKTIRKTWKICSKHFVMGKPSLKPSDVDYVPTLHPARRKNRSKPDVLDSSEATPDVMDSSQVIPDVMDSSQVIPDEMDSSRVIPDVMASSRVIPDVMDSSRVIPDVMDSSRARSDVMDSSQAILQSSRSGASKRKGRPHRKLRVVNGGRHASQSESSLNGGDVIQDIELADTRLKSGTSLKQCALSTDSKCEAVEASDDDGSISSTSASSVDEDTLYRSTQGVCPICSKDCKFPSRLKFHMRCHNSVKTDTKVTCSLCGKQLATKSGLKFHIEGVHSQYRHYVCDFCGQKFAGQSGLKAHRFLHTGENPHVCSICHKGFRKKSMLFTHELRMHNKPHVDHETHACTICGMKFLLKSRMVCHMEKHTGDSHVCKHCGRKFRHIGNLNTHIRGVHEGDTRYECDYCQKRFGNAYNLKVHMRTHTGEKPYYCKVCGKGFADVCNYRRHVVKCVPGLDQGGGQAQVDTVKSTSKSNNIIHRQSNNDTDVHLTSHEAPHQTITSNSRQVASNNAHYHSLNHAHKPSQMTGFSQFKDKINDFDEGDLHGKPQPVKELAEQCRGQTLEQLAESDLVTYTSNWYGTLPPSSSHPTSRTGFVSLGDPHPLANDCRDRVKSTYSYAGYQTHTDTDNSLTPIVIFPDSDDDAASHPMDSESLSPIVQHDVHHNLNPGPDASNSCQNLSFSDKDASKSGTISHDLEAKTQPKPLLSSHELKDEMDLRKTTINMVKPTVNFTKTSLVSVKATPDFAKSYQDPCLDSTKMKNSRDRSPHETPDVSGVDVASDEDVGGGCTDDGGSGSGDDVGGLCEEMDEAQSRWNSALRSFCDTHTMDPATFTQAANIYNFFPKP